MTMTFDERSAMEHSPVGESTIEKNATADMRLTPIGTGEWLIHDVRFTPEDPRCLVAFVREEAGKEADVIWLGRLNPPGSFTTADAVLRAAIQAAG